MGQKKVQGKICLSLTGIDAAAVYAQAEPVLDQVDVIEIRLDSMTAPEVGRCCSLLKKPLLFTNRPLWEGGIFDGPEEKRIGSLLEAVRQEVAYVDWELRAEQRLRKCLLAATQISPTRLILSWHDFEATPPYADLIDILAHMMNSGAHIGKVVTTAHSPEDVLRVLRLQGEAREAGFPLSCFCMGEAGRISRFATLYLGGYMTYACLQTEQATAAGQLSVSRLHQLASLLAPN